MHPLPAKEARTAGSWARALGAMRLLRRPVPSEKKRLLAERWATLDPRWRLPGQGIGQHATGCGATIGAYPKCDFDCEGCYLGEDANQIPRFSQAEIFRQLEELRRYLGPKGNVQITDGEVTLLPPAELISIVRHARSLDLIPMVMSHGDTFRRKPELLARLVREGGLREVSLHIDSMQHGRRGWTSGGSAGNEAALMSLRDEFAGMIRDVRRETGARLRGAMSVTISRDNLEAVGPIVDWCFRNRDAFGIISFQPLAHVGRTRAGLQGVAPAEVWRRIADALQPYGFKDAGRSPVQFGHPDCTRMEPLAVYQRGSAPPRVLPILRPGRAEDRSIVEGFLARGLGGLVFRDDTPPERVCRAVGVILSAPAWFGTVVRSWAAARAAELGTSLSRLLFDVARGRARVDSFNVVTHHFMGDEEVLTANGRERLAACVFRLPIAGEMVPMCQVNTSGIREQVYAQGSAERLPHRPSPLPILH